MEKYFVGDLALREGNNVGFELERDRHLNKHHDVATTSMAKRGDGSPVS